MKKSYYSDTSAITTSVRLTPNNTQDIAKPCRALLVDVAGFVDVVYVNGDIDIVYLAAGMWHGMVIARLNSTNTTATGIHAGY